MRVLPKTALAGLVVSLALASGSARADDRAAADALFQAAKALVGEGKYEEACPKFEASFRLDRTLGTLLNLADCHEKQGKIASASAEWGDAAELAGKSGDAREQFAKDRKAAIASRVPKLQVNVTNPVATLAVSRDELKIDPAMFGVAVPTDPGKHLIVVMRGAEKLKEESVELTEGQNATVNLDLAAIEKAAPPPQPAGPAGPATGGTGTATPPPSSSTQRTVGLVVGGVGAAAVIAAVIIEVMAISEKSTGDEPFNCVNKFCTKQGLDAIDSASTKAEVGQWVGIGGLVLVALGTTVFLLSPSPPKTGAAKSAGSIAAARRSGAGAWVSPWASPSAGGLAVGGRL